MGAITYGPLLSIPIITSTLAILVFVRSFDGIKHDWFCRDHHARIRDHRLEARGQDWRSRCHVEFGGQNDDGRRPGLSKEPEYPPGDPADPIEVIIFADPGGRPIERYRTPNTKPCSRLHFQANLVRSSKLVAFREAVVLTTVPLILSVILSVSAANVDSANSESLKLAQSVASQGRRTIGVLTKLDLMDAGTDANDILTGRTYPPKPGFIGVVDRSRQDINTVKSMTAALESEKGFFTAHSAYRNIAHKQGTKHLTKTLNQVS